MSDDKKKQKRKLAKAIAEKDKGNAAFAKGEYLQAVAAFSEAIKIDPENHVYYSNRAAAYAKLEKYDESEADARRCIALKPDFVKGYARYGAALFAKGDAKSAIEAYGNGLKHDKDDKLCREGLFQCQTHLEAVDKQKAEEAKWAVEAERQKKVIADREMAAFQAQKAAAAAAAAEGKAAAAPAGSAAPAAAAEDDAKHAAQLTGQGYGQSALRSDAEYQEFLKWKQSKEYAKYAADATGAGAGAGADAKDAKTGDGKAGDAKAGDAKAGDAKAATEYVIGIDLGTTYSCVGVWKDEKVEIIADAHGSRTTPSYIGLLPNGERVIGEPAKSRQAAFPKNVLYDIKRMIGQRFTDAGVAKDIRHFPFKVVEGPDSKPQVEVDFDNKTSKRFDPEALSAMVLSEMKTIAETYLGTSVRKAVITVPAYFSDAQRNATKAAGAIAGLEVLRIINEPTAAALSYGLDLHSLGKKKRVNTLIFDLGGGTFDVSLITIEGGIFEVKAIGGDTHLGGEDFDQNVVQHLIAEVKTAGCTKDVTADLKAMKRLRAASEKAKRELSNSQTADIKIENLVQDFDFTYRLTRQKFNELNNNLFLRCIDTVKHVMKDARMKVEDIHEVVLVGGSTRIPKVQELLSKYFNGKELCKSVNPDEAVAYGATVQAAILSGVRTKATKDVLLMDVTPLSLGIETVGRVMSVIIPRNSSIPTVKTQTYTTEENFQTAVDVCVYEGERLKTDGNNLLGKFTIKGIERAKRGEPQIDVSFSIDSDGILTVSAKDQKTGAVAQIEIKNRSQMNKDQLDKLVAEAERYKKEDEERLKRTEARNELERVINETMDLVAELQNADDPTAELVAEAKGDGAAAGAGAGKKKGGKGKGGVVSKKKAEENKKLAAVLEAAAAKTQEWLELNADAKPGELALKRRELERRIQGRATK